MMTQPTLVHIILTPLQSHSLLVGLVVAHALAVDDIGIKYCLDAL